MTSAAAATVFENYNFNFAAAVDSATTGTAANSASYSAADSFGRSVNVVATAWNATLATSGTNAGKYVLTQAYLGRYVAGLGVTSTGNDGTSGLACALGSCGGQQIDNVGNAAGSSSIDFVQLVFSTPVVLGSVSRRSAGSADGTLLGFGYDDDFSYGASSTMLSAGAVLASLSGLLGTSVATSGGCTVVAGGCNDTDVLVSAAGAGATAASRNWYVSAAIGSNYAGDGVVDSFTLSRTTAYAVSGAVPEPASWILMIGGFGLIGAALRRSGRGSLALPTP